jgi:hypothetical protein
MSSIQRSSSLLPVAMRVLCDNQILELAFTQTLTERQLFTSDARWSVIHMCSAPQCCGMAQIVAQAMLVPPVLAS